jgi:hypothetical protein
VFNFIEVKHRTRFGALVFFFPVVSLFFFFRFDNFVALLCTPAVFSFLLAAVVFRSCGVVCRRTHRGAVSLTLPVLHTYCESLFFLSFPRSPPRLLDTVI